MTIYEQNRSNIPRFRRMTSLTPDEFHSILPRFEEGMAARAAAIEAGRAAPRKNRRGQGAKPVLNTPADQLFFMLVYYCTYPLQIMHGALFGLSESQTCRIIHNLSQVMEFTFALTAPTRDAAALKAALLRVAAAGVEPVAVIDGTERPTQRPSTEPLQTDLYSGRFKQHAFKNLIVSVLSVILYLSPTVSARHHDKSVADECAFEFPPDWLLLQDTGFQGLNINGGAAGAMPIRRKKKMELVEWQKSYNRILSSHRVSVEHAIGGCKRARITKDIYRNRREGFNDHVIVLSASLSNFRKSCRGDHAKAIFINA
jgi:hypothetical protein